MPKHEPTPRHPGELPAVPPIRLADVACARPGALNRELAALPPLDALDLVTALLSGYALRPIRHNTTEYRKFFTCWHVVTWLDDGQLTPKWDRVDHQHLGNGLHAVIEQFRDRRRGAFEATP